MKLLMVPLFLSITLSAQLDTTNWYPLQVGNYWEYKTNDDSWTETYEVVKDTLMPNGRSYAKIRYCSSGSNFCGYVFQRVEDNSFVYFYDSWSDTEYIFYDFRIQENEYWDFGRDGHLRYLALNSEYLSEIFGTTLKIKKYIEHKFMPDTVGFTFETIAKGVGPIIYGWYTGRDEKDSTSLTGAIINSHQYGQITSTQNMNNIPTKFTLEQNYPNPFNPITTINYYLPAEAFVSIEIFDLLGRKVSTLIEESKKAGSYSIKFNGQNLPSGVYLYRMKTNSYSASKKFILIK